MGPIHYYVSCPYPYGNLIAHQYENKGTIDFMNITALTYVFIGGGLGAICRYILAIWLGKFQNGFPIGTFVANVISCIILGYFMGLFLKSDSAYKLLWMTGFCGGFSTFSTFSAENFMLLKEGQYTLALGYILASLLVCVVCIFIGLKGSEMFS